MELFGRRTLITAMGTALVTSGMGPVGATEDDACVCSETIGEGDGWSSYAGNPGNSYAVPSANGIDRPETVAWEYDETGELAVVDGTVYLRTDGDDDTPNEVHALDAGDGALEWTTDEIPVDGAPAVAGETVYVGGEQLTALDATDGSVRWEREFDGETDEREQSSFVMHPTVTYGRVYVVVRFGDDEMSPTPMIYALDPTDGSIDWERETVDVDVSRSWEESDVQSLAFRPDQIALANEAVFALTDGREAIVALDAMTGDKRWATAPSTLFESDLTATESSVYCSEWTMETAWRFDTETGEELDQSGGFLQTGGADEATGASSEYGVGTGEREILVNNIDGDGWNERFQVGAWLTFGIAGDTLVYQISGRIHLEDSEPQCVARSLEDGSVIWEISIGDELFVNDIQTIADGTIYDFSGGSLRALRPVTDDDGDGDEESPSEDGSDDESGQEDDRTDDSDDTDEDQSEDTDEGRSDDTDGDSESDDSEDGGENGTDGDDADQEDNDSDSGSDDADGDPSEATDEDDSEGGEESETDGGDDGDADANEDSETDGNDEDGGEGGDGDDGTPGFTPIAGMTGGALTLEWLRRRALGDDTGDEVDPT